MGLHEDRVLQDILLRRNLFPVGLEALEIPLDGLPGHFNGFLDGIAVGNATRQGRDDGSVPPFRFFPQQDSVADLFHDDHRVMCP